MNAVQVSKSHPLIARIVKATYPAWKGRKVRIELCDYPLDCRSYWDGGSRDYYVFLNLATMQTMPMPAQSAFDRAVPGADAVTLPAGVICVQRSVFCGKDCGLRIIVGTQDSEQLTAAGALLLTR